MVRTLLFILLLQFCCVPAAIGSDYIITEQQVVKLEQNLIQLDKINSKLQEQLKMLHSQLENQEQLLESANQSLEKFARNQRRKIRWLKFQRNVLVAGMVVAVVSKRM